MAFVAIYDACVLYPAPLRDLLLRLAATGLFRAQWTEEILDECFRNIRANRPDLKDEALDRTRALINQAVADCLVTGYESLISSVTLPDAKDRHVLAAAIRSGAQVIVTANLKDFPKTSIKSYGIEAQHPDEFVCNLVDLNPGIATKVIQEQTADLRKPPRSVAEVLATLEQNGLVQAVAKLRELLP